MIEVGAFDAKTHLSSLLDKVMGGEEVLIKRRGVPVARLVPAERAAIAQTEGLVRQLRALRSGSTLGELNWRNLRDEGRR